MRTFLRIIVLMPFIQFGALIGDEELSSRILEKLQNSKLNFLFKY
jgi:hypothetical protein